jgi:hypothetical protein
VRRKRGGGKQQQKEAPPWLRRSLCLSVLHILKKVERWAINIEEEYAKVDGRTVKTTLGVKLKLRMFFTWGGGAA